MAIGSIVSFCDSSWPVGGAEALALLSVRQFAAAGYKVTFFTGDDASKCPLDPASCQIIPLGSAPLLERPLADGSLSGIYNQKTYDVVSAYIRKHDTPQTVYHVHNWSKIFSPSLFRALKPVEARVFFSAHDFSLVCPNLAYSNYQKGGATCMLVPLSLECIATHCDRRSYSHKLWRVARLMAARKLLDYAHMKSLVGIIHPFMSEWYERGGIPRDRIRVLRNPVSPYSATRVAAETNQDLFFIGRVVHEKGVDLAAEAARQAGRRLRVIGDGDMRAELQARYPEAVFEGWRNHAEISELVREARAVLVPSRLPETFTLVAHEALRSGIPVIAFSDVDGQEAADIGAAIVVPPREASSLAEGIRRLESDDAVARMSRIAFEQCHAFSHTPDTWRDALLGYFEEMVAAATPHARPAPHLSLSTTSAR